MFCIFFTNYKDTHKYGNSMDYSPFFSILCKICKLRGFKRTDMKKERIRWMMAIGLLGLLGFASCSPKLRPRKPVDKPDTLAVPGPDTIYFGPVPPDTPIKLMYGVPPTRFEKLEVPEKDLDQTE